MSRQDSQPVEEAERARVRALIEQVTSRSLATARIAPFGSGARNALWKISIGDATWMARVAHANPGLNLDLAQEYLAHRAAALAGLAPRVIDAAPEAGLLLMDFVADAPWSARDVHRRLPELVRCVRALHSVPAPAGLATLDLVAAVQALIRAARLRDAGELDLDWLEKRLQALERASRSLVARTFCHNDLHHLNLLGERPLIIDWEYAARGDPHVDLAAIATYHDFGAPERGTLLSTYGSPLSRELFDMVCQLFDALHLAWLVAAGVWDQAPADRRARLIARVGSGTGTLAAD